MPARGRKRVSRKPHFHVAAGLIWRGRKVLISKRPQGSHLAGFWEFPGGKQEDGETLSRGLERELKEELGIEVRADNLFLSVQHEYETKRVTLHFFQCSVLKGRPKSLEGQTKKWVAPKDLPKYSFPPPDLEVIEILSSCLSTSL